MCRTALAQTFSAIPIISVRAAAFSFCGNSLAGASWCLFAFVPFCQYFLQAAGVGGVNSPAACLAA